MESVWERLHELGLDSVIELSIESECGMGWKAEMRAHGYVGESGSCSDILEAVEIAYSDWKDSKKRAKLRE